MCSAVGDTGKIPLQRNFNIHKQSRKKQAAYHWFTNTLNDLFGIFVPFKQKVKLLT
jgi:hypothetical protein